MTPNHPTTLGRYQVKKLLGKGAMGRVYLAEDPVIGREVAVKIIHLHAGLEKHQLQELQGRFEREFRAAGTMTHPHIVTIYDVGHEGEEPFLAMEYVAGESLDSILASDRDLTFGEISDIADQLGSALDYAHERGIVHRDVKPGNVLVNWDGQAKITDFGVVKMTSSTVTRTGTLIGTPAYMSPEQILGGEVTGASDQFSLGVILYQLLTGQRPFQAENTHGVMYKVVHQDPIAPAEIRRELPTPIDEVLLRALAKDAAERFPDCKSFAKAIREALSEAVPGGDLTLSPANEPFAMTASSDSHTGWIAAAIVALLLVGVGVWFVLTQLGAEGHGEVAAPAPNKMFSRLVDPPGSPGVEIWLDGENEGLTTPDTVTVTGQEGDVHQLELRRGEEVLASTAWQLGENASPEWKPDLTAGGAGSAAPQPSNPDPPPAAAPETLRIISSPAGATVLLDGASQGTTPLEVQILPGRRYDLGLRLEGHKAQGIQLAWETLTEAQRQGRELSFQLPPVIPPGFIAVNTSYPVTVTFSGKSHGPGTSLRIPIKPGQYEVSLTAPEVFLNFTRTVQVASGEDATITPPELVEVTITAIPENCRVTIDGREVDSTPIFDRPVAAGRHELLFEWPADGVSRTLVEVISPSNRRFVGTQN